MIIAETDAAISDGASQKSACETIGLSERTIQRWRQRNIGDDNRAGPRTAPANKLSAKERKELLKVMTSKDFRNLSPHQVVVRLADLGTYLASESTMYRILREQGLQPQREPTRETTKRYRPKPCVATGPNQVWTWDISYLHSPVKGLYYYAYTIIDIFSRKIVGHAEHDSECGELATELIASACRREGVDRRQLVIHSDNGGPMRSATLLATLQYLGVATSFSRPSVSNDNPYSESLFGTLKSRPNYPSGAFKSLEAARAWVTAFVRWYNDEHRHSGINYVTPNERHSGKDIAILRKRTGLYETARKKHQNRWTGGVRNWGRPGAVTLNPAVDGGAENVA